MFHLPQSPSQEQLCWCLRRKYKRLSPTRGLPCIYHCSRCSRGPSHCPLAPWGLLTPAPISDIYLSHGCLDQASKGEGHPMAQRLGLLCHWAGPVESNPFHGMGGPFRSVSALCLEEQRLPEWAGVTCSCSIVGWWADKWGSSPSGLSPLVSTYLAWPS